MERNCGNCGAFFPNPNLKVARGQPMQGWCRRRPPLPFPAMVQINSPLDPKGPQMTQGWQSAFPPLDTTCWCLDWVHAGARNAAVVIEHEEANNNERPVATADLGPAAAN